MYCEKCGTQLMGNGAFCTACGAPASGATGGAEQVAATPVRKLLGLKRLLQVGAIIAVLGFGAFYLLDNEAIESNNDAVDSFQAGDNEQAASQLQQAYEDAQTDETKLNTLKNLAYVQDAEGNYTDAKQSFRQALEYTSEGTLDYYLINGEIAYYEGKPGVARDYYLKAYEKDQNDFQVNTSLTVFYLDLENSYPSYVDYKAALQHAQLAYTATTDEITKQNLAIAHFFNESYNETISLLSTSNFTEHPYAAVWLGLAYAGNDDEVNARRYLQQAADAGIELPPEVAELLTAP